MWDIGDVSSNAALQLLKEEEEDSGITTPYCVKSLN